MNQKKLTIMLTDHQTLIFKENENTLWTHGQDGITIIHKTPNKTSITYIPYTSTLYCVEETAEETPTTSSKP